MIRYDALLDDINGVITPSLMVWAQSRLQLNKSFIRYSETRLAGGQSIAFKAAVYLNF